MTYTTKMSLAIAAIGTLTFGYISNCEAKTGTFPEYFSCEDIVGIGYNECMKENQADQKVVAACAAGRDAIMKIPCTNVGE